VLLWKWNDSKAYPKHEDSMAGLDSSSLWEFVASTAVMAPAAKLTVSSTQHLQLHCHNHYTALIIIFLSLVEHGKKPSGCEL